MDAPSAACRRGMRHARQRLTVGGVVGRVDPIRQDDGDHRRNCEDHDLAWPRPADLLNKPPPHGERFSQHRGLFGVRSARRWPGIAILLPAWRLKAWHATLSGPALLAQLVEHFHGKEGVVGSSPTEGLAGFAAKSGWGTVRRCTSRRMRTSSTRSVDSAAAGSTSGLGAGPIDDSPSALADERSDFADILLSGTLTAMRPKDCLTRPVGSACGPAASQAGEDPTLQRPVRSAPAKRVIRPPRPTAAGSNERCHAAVSRL